MNKSLKPLLLLMTTAGVLVLNAMAQQTKPIAQWSNLNLLERGSEIRVVLNDGRTITGFLQSVSVDSMAINASTSQEALSRRDVKLVSMKRAGHRGRNTVIGLLIGVGAGLASGAAIDRNSHGWFPNLGKDVFTPLGAIIGTVVGVAVPTGGWRLVYRAA
jgi:hypothetical protein